MLHDAFTVLIDGAGQVNARVHQQRAGINLAGIRIGVELFGVKAAQALDVFTDYEAEYMEKAGFYE